MNNGLDILSFLEKAETIPVIDVRTPAEYSQGHIPNAPGKQLFSEPVKQLKGKKREGS